jgi:hypothetical protein
MKDNDLLDERKVINRDGSGARRRAVKPLGAGVLCCFLVLGIQSAACTQTPVGPRFVAASMPTAHRARVYVYRADDRGSLATVRISLDGREIGRLRDREYVTVEVPVGPHQLQAGMRGFGFVSWGWNDQRFRTNPGETVYLKIAVRLSDRAAPTTPELDIAGRTSGAASENVFIIPQSSVDALAELATTTLLSENQHTPSDPD